MNFGTMEFVEFMLQAFFYDQVECSGWAYGILILAARAATRFPPAIVGISRDFAQVGERWDLEKTF